MSFRLAHGNQRPAQIRDWHELRHWNDGAHPKLRAADRGSTPRSIPCLRGLVAPAGNDICIVTSAGNAVQAIIYYTYQQ